MQLQLGRVDHINARVFHTPVDATLVPVGPTGSATGLPHARGCNFRVATGRHQHRGSSTRPWMQQLAATAVIAVERVFHTPVDATLRTSS